MNTTKESYANWIDVGEGFELVSWTTQITFAAQFTHDGKTWIDMFGQDQTPAYWICLQECGRGPDKPILAVRRKVEKTWADAQPLYGKCI